MNHKYCIDILPRRSDLKCNNCHECEKGEDEMTQYVVGFAFTANRQEVLLIEKARSRSGFEWMIGKLNGIGGKVHEKENPFLAMTREFHEEAGIVSDWHDWKICGKLVHADYEVIVFSTFTDAVKMAVTSSEEGEVNLVRVADLRDLPTVKNLAWVIPLVLKEDLTAFEVVEG
jgi:8-oxo-dGTP pyrophosphatase MutT (NUDIX family)